MWMAEIQPAGDFLISNGVVDKIFGFRTPYLEYSDGVFTDLKELGYEYDCSIEEGYEDEQDGTNFYFPYTLDNRSPGHTVQVSWGEGLEELTDHPGLWELPVYSFIVPPDLRDAMKSRVDWFDTGGGQITGFDYNLWVDAANGGFSMSKDEFLATLKYSLDQRLRGNHAPMLFGAHTAYYVDSYSASTPNATTAERRAAIEEFLDYAMSKPEVRIVPHKAVLDWMRAPKPM